MRQILTTCLRMLIAVMAGLLVCFLGNQFPNLSSCIYLPLSAMSLGIIGALAAGIGNRHTRSLRSTLGISLLAWLSFCLYALVIMMHEPSLTCDEPLICDAGFQTYLFALFSLTVGLAFVIGLAVMTMLALKKTGWGWVHDNSSLDM